MSQALFIDTDKVVTLIYKVYNEKNELIDSATRMDPFQYLQGHKNIMPGLEAQLQGLKVGYKGLISVPNAYGERNLDLVQTVSEDLFTGLPEGMELREGLYFLAATDKGDVPVKVVEIDKKKGLVTVDANLELAGQTLTFDLEIIGIREATIDEIAQGCPTPDDGSPLRPKM
ncbi:FKBP-type peptidyl-prolyl cis-trans isomerase [Psittacicella hinzii]|uniref:Peptidyl-prolyl cis-trans isomerase n=1 Tax=Psittacicella hinzii TaxID=2028575 RepID=A0A3A1YG16_9GAMM|nr:peptidylprolyl isomerase [Psittacicella hinzii]RIY36030.1 hypothetical protein CKF58_06300 [Psittacicella hinzii]